MKPWPDLPMHQSWLRRHCLDLLDFGRRFPHPDGGAAWLDDDGVPDLDQPVHTYVTARMAHVYSLGALLGVPGCGALADRALAGLTGRLHDDRHGGWFESTAEPGKACYAHAFVILAAASALTARRPGAADLLDDALDVFTRRFWDDDAGMAVDAYDAAFTRPEQYRGLNANMHSVEALLAAADATGRERYRAMACRITDRVVGWAAESGWRIPEHFDAQWNPQPDYNRDRADDPFKPYGATVGHALEWSRLLLAFDDGALVAPAVALFDRAVQDGWSADGAPGFVYTTDWDGRPVVRDRMHWVAAEAVVAAAAVYRRTGEPSYADLYAQWWDYIETYLHDRARGSWHHQLDATNRPTDTVWSGKPDLYHAVQATLIPLLPPAPSLAAALR